jgi:hypothetical protein
LHKLAILDLSNTKVTDEGIPQLLQLQSLHWVLLCKDPITDTTLERLAALPDLMRLSIVGTKASAAGIKRLKQAKPRITIDD